MQNQATDTTFAAEKESLAARYPRVADPALKALRAKVLACERLNQADGLSLFKTQDLVGLGQLADYARKRTTRTRRITSTINTSTIPMFAGISAAFVPLRGMSTRTAVLPFPWNRSKQICLNA